MGGGLVATDLAVGMLAVGLRLAGDRLGMSEILGQRGEG